MRSVRFTLTVLAAATVGLWIWGIYEIVWAISHSSLSTLYTPGHPPPILKMVDDHFALGAIVGNIAMAFTIIWIIGFAIERFVIWRYGSAMPRGFDVLQ